MRLTVIFKLLGSDNDIPAENNTNTTNTTTTDDNHNTIFTEPVEEVGLTYGDLSSNQTDIDHADVDYNIAKVLAMPYLMKTTQFSTETKISTSGGDPAIKFHFPKDAISKIKKDKMRNFAFSKFDVQIRITVSAPKTASGIFLIVYAPHDSDTTMHQWIGARSLSGLSQYPSTVLNIAESTSVEFLIPYLDESECYNMIRDDGTPIVDMNVYLLTPIRGVTTSTGQVTMQFYSSLVNAKTTAPTHILPDSDSPWKSQMKSENGKKGVVSEIAGAVGGIADAVSTVPIIGRFSKPVKLISDLVGGVASLLGWSKPTSYEALQITSNTPGFGYSHSKGIDNSVKLGMSQETEISLPTDQFNSNVDEMDIESMVNIPYLFKTAIWSDASDFKWWDYVLKEQIDNTTTGFSEVMHNNFFQHISQLFEYVRTDIVIKLQIAKTAFHSGKLELFFTYGTGGLDWPEDSSQSYRVVWDISESNEIEFVIPYMHHNTFYKLREGNYGVFQLRNITPLQYTEGVEPNVDILIWKSYRNTTFMCPKVREEIVKNPQEVMKHVYPNIDYPTKGTVTDLLRDMEFEDLTFRLHQRDEGPWYYTLSNAEVTITSMDNPTIDLVTNQQYKIFGIFFTEYSDGFEGPTQVSGLFTILDASYKWKSQMKIEETSNKTTINTIASNTNSLKAICDIGGEVVVNLRYLTRGARPGYVGKISKEMYVNFYSANNLIQDDMFSYISQMYRMARGGIRYKLISSNPTGRVISCLANSESQQIQSQITHATFNNINPIHEVEVPYYSNNRKHILGNQGENVFGVKFFLTEEDENAVLLQSAADDFSFGYRIGPPRLNIRVQNKVITLPAFTDMEEAKRLFNNRLTNKNV